MLISRLEGKQVLTLTLLPKDVKADQGAEQCICEMGPVLLSKTAPPVVQRVTVSDCPQHGTQGEFKSRRNV